MKSCRAVLFILIFIAVCSPALTALDGQEKDDAPVPILTVFYRVGYNLFEPIICDYGIWYATAIFSTMTMVESGADWGWRNIAWQHQTLAQTMLSAEIAGYAVPVGFPLAAYIAGRVQKDKTLQLASLASLQAVGVAEFYHVVLKLATGRKAPGITNGLTDRKNDESCDFSGDFSFFTGKRGFLDGWPSGHTMAVVAMSVSFSHIYRDAPYLKAALYIFSGLMTVGMSLNSHWASDVLAGALIGYAAGKTVGHSFDALRPGASAADTNIKPYVLPSTEGVSAGIRIRL